MEIGDTGEADVLGVALIEKLVDLLFLKLSEKRWTVGGARAFLRWIALTNLFCARWLVLLIEDLHIRSWLGGTGRQMTGSEW